MRPGYDAEAQVAVAYVAAPSAYALYVPLLLGPIRPFLLNTPFFLFLPPIINYIMSNFNML